jgi:hypothetical protein
VSETAVIVVLRILEVENSEISRTCRPLFLERGDASYWWELVVRSVGFEVSKIINSVTQKTVLHCKHKKLHVNVTLQRFS